MSDDRHDSAQPRRRAFGPIARPSASTAIFALGLAIQSIVTGVLVDRGYFFSDDFINFDNVRSGGLTFHTLAADIFGHFIPLFNLVNLIIVRVAAYNYPLIVALDVALSIGTLLALFRLLTLVLPARRGLAVALTLGAGCSLITVPGALWWSNSASNFPSLMFTLLTIDASWRYLERKRTRHLLGAFVCLALGLGFFESTLIALVVVVIAWPLLVFDPGRDGSLVRATLRRWPLAVALGLPVALDLGYRLANSATYVLSPRPTVAEMGAYLRTAWGLGFGPGMIGVDYPYREVLSSPTLTVVIGQVALLGTIVATGVWFRRGWRGWIVFLVAFAAYVLPTGYARAGYHGADSGLFYDYLFYGPYLFVLGIALAARGDRRWPARVGPHEEARPGSVAFGLFGGALLFFAALFGVIASSLVSAVSISGETSAIASATLFENPASPRSSRQFFTTAVRSLALVRQDDSHPVIFDTYAPVSVVGWWFSQHRPDSQAITDAIPALRFDRVGSSGYVFDGSGRLVPAHFVVDAEATMREVSGGHSGVVPSHGPGREACFFASASGPLFIPFANTAGVAQLPEPEIHLAYTSSTTFSTVPEFLTGETEITALRLQPTFVFHVGTHAISIAVNSGFSFANLVFDLPQGAHLCLASAVAGHPAPDPPPGARGGPTSSPGRGG